MCLTVMQLIQWRETALWFIKLQQKLCTPKTLGVFAASVPQCLLLHPKVLSRLGSCC